MRSIRRIPRSKQGTKLFLELVSKREAEAVPIEVWSEVGNSALRSRATTRFVAALVEHLRSLRRTA
jgi:hypothetical protein